MASKLVGAVGTTAKAGSRRLIFGSSPNWNGLIDVSDGILRVESAGALAF